MYFTYDSYVSLIDLLKEHNYKFADYHNWQNYDRCVIMRHDIDSCIEKACKLAEIEQTVGVSSTWFVLLTSDFYNIFSKKSTDGLKYILSLGHTIGLHYDEKRYPETFGAVEQNMCKIQREREKCTFRVVKDKCQHSFNAQTKQRNFRKQFENDRHN